MNVIPVTAFIRKGEAQKVSTNEELSGSSKE
jgi:hypothetical protein